MRRTSHIIAAAALTAISAGASAQAQSASGWGGQVRFTASVDAGIGQTRMGRDVDGLLEGDFRGSYLVREGGKGLSLGANVGVEVGRDWAFQIEAQYLNLDSRTFYYGSEAGDLVSDDEAHLFAGFLTAQYRVPISGYFRPYLGAGVGMLTEDFGSDGRDYLFATKLQLGGDLAVANSYSIYGQYDLIAPESKFDQTSALLHVGRVGLKKRF